MDRFDNEMPDRAKSLTKRLVTISTGNNNLFNIIGGPVKIIEIIGIVAVQIEGKSCLINYNMDPTSPAGDTAFATAGAALEINGDTVGSLYTWTGVIGTNLAVSANGVALGMEFGSGIICPAGSLELAAVVNIAATGTIDFYIRYEPLVPGVRIEAV